MNKVVTILTCCVLILVSACKNGDSPKPELTPEESNEAREAIVAWLECEECREGQLEAVVELGDVVVPTLAAVLAQGPAPATRELVRRRLEQAYKDMLAYQVTHPDAKVQLSEDEYIEKYLGNFEAMYRVRAATALGRIGGDEAGKALMEAATRGDMREDVRLAIDSALKQ